MHGWGDRLPHVRAIRFGGPHGLAVGVVFPSRCVRPYLWHPCRGRPRGKRGRSPRPPSTLSRERCEPNDGPRCLPSSKSLRPAAPFRTSGSGLPRLRGLATATPAIHAFAPSPDPCGPPRAGLPSTRPAANGRRASLSLGVACRLLQPETTRGHTLRAFNPRTRAELSLRCRHPRMPVCVGRSARCRTGGLRATICTRRLAHDAFRLHGRGRSRAEELEQRRTARSWTMSRVPFS